MRRSKLPPQLKPAAAVAALATAVSVTAAADTAIVAAPPEPALQLIQQSLPAGTSELTLEVGGDGSGRLVFGTLRTDAALSVIALVDPQGRTVWRRAPAELGVVPRSQTPRPELGDAIFLPEQLRPAPGRWRLQLARSHAAPSGARAMLSYRLLPRYSLAFWKAPPLPAAGQPLLLTLRPTDMGRPVQQPAALTVQVQPRQAGALPLELQARQDLAGPTGARISTEPGTYLALWRPPQAGSYDVQARWQAPGLAVPLVAVQRVDVAAAVAQLRFSSLSAEGLPACVRELVLRFAVQLDAPPLDTTVHALAVRLLGARQAQQVSTSVRLDGRDAQVELRLARSRLQALGWPLQRIESSQLTRIAPDLKVLITGDAVDLSGLLPNTPLCP